MAEKYRIRLKTGRVVGPFVAEQVGELYLKGHITGQEDCQEFPVGDWFKISSHPHLKRLLTQIANKEIFLESLQNTKTHTVAQLNAAQKAKKEQEVERNSAANAPVDDEFTEFKFGIKSDGPEVDYDELEKKYSKRIKEEQDQEEKKKTKIESTVIIKRPNLEQVEKTRIVTPQLSELSDPDKSQSKNEHSLPHEEEANKSSNEKELENEISADEKTEFFNLDSAMAGLKVEAKAAEQELEEKAIESRKEAEKDLIDFADDEEDYDVDEEEQNEEAGANNKKKIRPITILIGAALLIFLLLPEEDKEVVIKPNYLDINYPVAKEFKDEVKANREYERGLEDLQKNTYTSSRLASQHFMESLEHKFKDNPAADQLLYIYSKYYHNASDEVRASKNLFRLIKLNNQKVLKEELIAVSTALFYLNNKKMLTAEQTIENYLRISKPTELVYSVYLNVLTANGKYDTAKTVLTSLENINDKSIDSYLAISNYYYIDQRFDEALKYINQGLKRYVGSVPLLLKKSSIQLTKKNFKAMNETLAEVKANRAENSPVYYSKYLEQLGILSAVKGEQAQAAQFFNEALDYYDSDELRSMLAQAEVKGKKSTQALILESKVIELMGRAKEERRQRNWDMALSYAIEAADMMPNYIPAQILLVSIQGERGFFEPALANLERLRKDFPVNASINYSLIKTYLLSHRIEDAEREIAILAHTDFALTPEYSMALGEFYEITNNLRMSIRFYNESIKRHPLNDNNYYRLAKIYLKYKRFDLSKEKILDAIELDPRNVYYHSVYAAILYETQTSDAAIGYLRGVLERNEDHPKILGDIAIYYYRLGKINEFNEYKKRVEELNIRDQSFYEFLVESARLRGKEKEVVDYSRELIRVNPGNLEVRMDLGQYLLKRGYYEDALDEFMEVTKRLETYPKANYYIAKCYIVKDDYEKALEFAEKEIEGNPTLDSGYFIKGEVFRLQKNYQESVKLLEKAISINGESVEALLALGWIKFRQNYLDTARELYRRALREDPSIPEAHLQLGHIFRSSGQGRLAIESYQTYLKLAPNAPDRKQVEGRIMQLQ